LVGIGCNAGQPTHSMRSCAAWVCTTEEGRLKHGDGEREAAISFPLPCLAAQGYFEALAAQIATVKSATGQSMWLKTNAGQEKSPFSLELAKLTRARTEPIAR
jgi:hypothetical protein